MSVDSELPSEDQWQSPTATDPEQLRQEIARALFPSVDTHAPSVHRVMAVVWPIIEGLQDEVEHWQANHVNEKRKKQAVSAKLSDALARVRELEAGLWDARSTLAQVRLESLHGDEWEVSRLLGALDTRLLSLLDSGRYKTHPDSRPVPSQQEDEA